MSNKVLKCIYIYAKFLSMKHLRRTAILLFTSHRLTLCFFLLYSMGRVHCCLQHRVVLSVWSIFVCLSLLRCKYWKMSCLHIVQIHHVLDVLSLQTCVQATRCDCLTKLWTLQQLYVSGSMIPTIHHSTVSRWCISAFKQFAT